MLKLVERKSLIRDSMMDFVIKWGVNMDIVFVQVPNKTIEIAPLGSSLLEGYLKSKGYAVKQYDFNVEIKMNYWKKRICYIFMKK